MLPDYTKRMWQSLNQLKERIEKDGKEKVVDFNGFELITNKRRFTLYDGMLFAEKQ
jgi:hypothetical protein